MPVIYATKKLEDIHTRLVQEHPKIDVILVLNGPQGCAWGGSARLICKARGWRAKKFIIIGRDSLDETVTALNALDKTVGVADLDEPAPPGGSRAAREE